MTVSESLLQQFQEITMQSRRTAYYFIDMFGRGNLNDAIMSFYDLGAEYIPSSYVAPNPASTTPTPPTPPRPVENQIQPTNPVPIVSPTPASTPTEAPRSSEPPDTTTDLTTSRVLDEATQEDDEFIMNDDLIHFISKFAEDKDSLKFDRVREKLHQFFDYSIPPPRLSQIKKQTTVTEDCRSHILEFNKSKKKINKVRDNDIIIQKQPNLNTNDPVHVIVWRNGLSIDGKFEKKSEDQMKIIISDIKKGKVPEGIMNEAVLNDMSRHKYNTKNDVIDLLENF